MSKERTDNQRLGDISYQISILTSEMRKIREIISANRESIFVTEDDFNNDVAGKLFKDK